MYALLRPLLFHLDAERAHHLITRQLNFWTSVSPTRQLIAGRWGAARADRPFDLLGLTFPNRVGLAAGFDKDARYLHAMQALGFGFVEIGTVTPRPQDGNPQPRLFRLPRDGALINRMGFNNDGLEAVRERLAKRPPGLIVGGNIGKNKDTPNEHATDDYLTCFRGLRDRVDYFVVNVSSPNTPGLRSLQDRGPLTELLTTLRDENGTGGDARPLLLKIAPDLSDEQIIDTVKLVSELGIDGIVACNTTIGRTGLATDDRTIEAIGAGGLSGSPVRDRAADVVRLIRNHAPNDLAVIGVGGISTANHARERLDAGADLIQIYTGFIYRGPDLVGELKSAIAARSPD
ncbi:MAG: quinone-dependent dihydroorotate dehydrogenase [Pseudomonadota bacterium]